MALFFICLGLTSVFTLGIIRVGGLSKDTPNSRSSHSRVTPRGGGLAFLGVALVTFSIGYFLECHRSSIVCDNAILLVVGASLGFGILGTLEDLLNLSVPVRFLAELFIALFLSLSGLRWRSFDLGGDTMVLPLWASHTITVLWYIWGPNLYNFMDGINGIATLKGICLSALFFYLAGLADLPALALLMLCIGGSLVGFLPFNFPRSRIFMGDTGSLFLGSLFATIPVYAHLRDPRFSPLLAILALAPFLLDTTITLAERLYRKENVLSPHRSHYYQKLNEVLHSHLKTSMAYTLLSIAFALSVAKAYRLENTGRFFVALILLSSLIVFFRVIQAAWLKETHRAFPSST